MKDEALITHTRHVRRSTITTAAAIAGALIFLAPAGSALAAKGGNGNANAGGPSDPENPVKTIGGVFRDFRKHNQPGGHPDFGKIPNAGEGHTVGNVLPTLDADGKPVYTGVGLVVTSQWRDAMGRSIHPSQFDAARGDIPGSYGTPDDGAIDSTFSYSQWYRDVPGLNTSAAFSLNLDQKPDGLGWILDEKIKTNQAIIGGGSNSNFEYSYEIEMTLDYIPGTGQFLTIGGMDDMFAYINGQIVVDLGGVNHGTRQTVHLDRLGLDPNATNTLKIFMTERIKQREDIYFEFGFDVTPGKIPTTMAMYD
ncbi:MAG: fibro-slime domain-containing protein [Phycisphaerales bacterium JB043]